MIWCADHPNVHIHTFCKRLLFNWGFFFPVNILNDVVTTKKNSIQKKFTWNKFFFINYCECFKHCQCVPSIPTKFVAITRKNYRVPKACLKCKKDKTYNKSCPCSAILAVWKILIHKSTRLRPANVNYF